MCINNFISSAKQSNLQWSKLHTTPLTRIENKMGDKCSSWGTPDEAKNKLDLTPNSLTHWCLQLRYDLNYFIFYLTISWGADVPGYLFHLITDCFFIWLIFYFRCLTIITRCISFTIMCVSFFCLFSHFLSSKIFQSSTLKVLSSKELKMFGTFDTFGSRNLKFLVYFSK